MSALFLHSFMPSTVNSLTEKSRRLRRSLVVTLFCCGAAFTLLACQTATEIIASFEPTATNPLPVPNVVYSTATFTPTFTPSSTPTLTPTLTPTGPTLTPSLTPTFTLTLTPSLTPSLTPTFTLTPSNTPTPTPTFTPTNTPTPTPTFTPFPTKVPGVTDTPVATYAPFSGTLESHFMFGRPIGADSQDFASPNYRYGETQGGLLPMHYAIDLENPTGTPILAVGDGEVVFAGPDWEDQFGPMLFFYGTMVVLKHDFPYKDQPVYTLYGHMSEALVETGDRVNANEIIGLVGGSGAAQGGPHLHFEVRVGYNDYWSTRNPELWLKPAPGWGALAGRVVDEDGNLVRGAQIIIRGENMENADFNGITRYVDTYHGPVNPDDDYGENFGLTDLPPGEYSVGVRTDFTSRTVKVVVEKGKLAWVEFRDVVPPALPAAAAPQP